MLHCEDVRPELSALLDRELPLWKAQVIRWHLFRCPECAEEMALIQHTHQTLRILPDQSAEPDLLTRIVSQAEAEVIRPGRFRRAHQPWPLRLRHTMRRHVLVPVLASVMLVAVGISLISRSPEQEPVKQEDTRVVAVDLLMDQPARGYILSGW